MNRIFLCEASKHDVSKALDYGQLVTIFPQNVGRPSIWSDQWVPAFLDELAFMRFDPQVDYLLVAGNTVLLVQAVAAMVAKYGEVRALVFSQQAQAYVPKTLGVTHDASRIAGRGS